MRTRRQDTLHAQTARCGKLIREEKVLQSATAGVYRPDNIAERTNRGAHQQNRKQQRGSQRASNRR